MKKLLLAILLLCCAAGARAFDAGTIFPSGSIYGYTRDYYLHREFRDNIQESMGLGGGIGYSSPRVAGTGLNVMAYGVMGAFFKNPERDGGNVLAPGQKNFGVIGLLNAEWENDTSSVTVFRQNINTPLINTFDSRIVPYTYEAYTVSHKTNNASLILSQVNKVKKWTATDFAYMSEAAGIGGSKKSVTLGGGVFDFGGGHSLSVYDYYAYDFMNSVYAEYRRLWHLDDITDFSVSVQGLDQRDTGSAIGGRIKADQIGILGTLSANGGKVSLGATKANNMTNVVNPWGSYPGYTSIVEEDCDLAGERAWVLMLSYDMGQIGADGLLLRLFHSEAEVPPMSSWSTPDQRETDFIADYAFSGRLKGLSMELKTAFVSSSASMAFQNYQDYRLITAYTF